MVALHYSLWRVWQVDPPSYFGEGKYLAVAPEVGSLLIDSMSLPLVLAPTLTPTPTPSLTPYRNPDPDHHPQP